MSIVVSIIIIALLLCASGFFSSSETALFSLNPIQIRRIQDTSPRSAELIRSLLHTPTQILSTILIGNTIVNVAASVYAFGVVESLVPGRGELIAVPGMTLLLLIFGEIAPKRTAMRWAPKMAAIYAPVLIVLNTAFTPARLILEFVTDWFKKYLPSGPRPLTEEEFRSVVSISEEEGVLDEEERTMVDGIIRLEEIQASDVMTPRVDMIGIDLNDDPSTYVEIARHCKVHYLPLYRDSMDEVVGFLNVLTFLLSPDHDLNGCRISATSVPETAPLSSLLPLLQRGDQRVAIVADEYGGTAGLVTLGDILEEIVEDVDNEYRQDELTMDPLGPNKWLIDGRVSLEDINYELGLNLGAEGVDRISGWVSAKAERIPRQGEEVESQHCRAKVMRVRKNRITLIELTRLEAPDDEDEKVSKEGDS